MNKPMTKQEWMAYIEKTWDAAQKKAWAEQQKPVAWRFDHKDGQGYCYYDERWPAEFIPQDATPLYL